MKLKKFKTGKVTNVNVLKYKVDWDKKVSGPQYAVKAFLRKYWSCYTILEEFRIPGCLLRVDLINLGLNIAVEVSPNSTHDKFNKFMHGSVGGYLKMLEHDRDKEEWLIQNGFTVVTLVDEDINDLTVKRFREKFNIKL